MQIAIPLKDRLAEEVMYSTINNSSGHTAEGLREAVCFRYKCDFPLACEGRVSTQSVGS